MFLFRSVIEFVCYIWCDLDDVYFLFELFLRIVEFVKIKNLRCFLFGLLCIKYELYLFDLDSFW